MTSLPALLGTLRAILQADPLCKRVANVETKEFAPDQFLLKIRAELTGRTSLQVRVYYNQGHVDYAYQLFADAPLRRWDSKEEFRSVATYPHHHHDELGQIHASPLVGEPVTDINSVLEFVSQFLLKSAHK